MDSKEILKYCIEKGILLDKDILKIFNDISIDSESVKLILEKIKIHTNQRILTKDFLLSNKKYLDTILLDFPKEKQKNVEILKIKLGLNIQISKEVSIEVEHPKRELLESNPIKVLSSYPLLEKKVEVKDFVSYFRNRLSEMKKILQEHSELKNLISINKVPGNKQSFSIIGIVSDKRVTKTKSILFEVEDLTGK